MAILDRDYKRDRQGRFGSGGSGVRDSLAAAKTTDEVAAVTAAELQTVMGRPVKVDLKGMDVDIARESMEGILQGAERFPVTRLSSVTTYGPRGAITAHPADPNGDQAFAVHKSGRFSQNDDEIAFNVTDIPGVYRAKIEIAHVAGYGVSEGPTGVALHEFGHAVDHVAQASMLARSAASASAAAAGQSVATHVRAQISHYATENAHELVGEAFASAMTRGDKAPKLARDIMSDVQFGYDREAPRFGSDPNYPPRARSRFFELVAAARNRTYKRDADGQFSSGSSGGTGSDSDFDEDEFVGAGDDEGDYGYGKAPDGSSYSEFDLDEDGGPRFSAEYRAKYGPIDSESGIGAGLMIVHPEHGKLHIADDALGARQRQVVQEFTPKEAHELGDGVWSVYQGESSSVTTKSGVTVAPAGPNPTRDGVNVTWANGRTSTFDGEAGEDYAFDLQESLTNVD